MNKIMKFLIVIISLTINSCNAQHSEEFLFGSWVLSSNYESPDIIIFRTDHKYFVYNSGSVSPESIGKSENLDSDDLLINDAYTSMTEKGKWRYNNSTKELVLYDRDILENWTDFSEAYGKNDELKFYINQKNEDEIEFCFDRQQKRLCDMYVRNWSYKKNDVKIFYNEISETYSGEGNQIKEIILSGYEKELKLSFNLKENQGRIVISDGNKKQLLNKEVKTADGIVENKLSLSGVTTLSIKVETDKPESKWNLNVELK